VSEQSLEINPQSTRIGWIGTGVMGRSMCGHLMDAGYRASVFNRTPEKSQPLVDKGAKLLGSPREVAEQSDVVFTIVGFPEDVESVLLGNDGVLAGSRAGMTIIDMTTSRPSLAEKIAARALAKGVDSLDAPVSGGDLGARNAALSIMIGGDAAAATRIEPLFRLMGKTIVYQGGPGRGQHTKMVNQTLIASGMIAVCEALLYASKAGLDLTRVLESVSSGAAGSWSLSNLAPRMIAGNFDPGFFVEHFLKDMRIALQEAAAMNLALPGLALAQQLYQAVAAQGHAKDGTQALILALASLNHIQWPPSPPAHS
jgi:3-hydroxyisobutyrate dehydrogenase